MLRKATVVLAVVALVVTAGAAMAGDYHSGTTLICADCHTMHYSMQHSFTGGTPPEFGASGPYTYLLRDEPNALCLQCHDGQTFAPDVLGANTGTHIREGGALPTGSSPYEDWKGHSLGSADPAPGGSWAGEHGLECVSCHAQHGHTGGLAPGAGYPAGYANGQWRILRNKPAGSATPTPLTYAKGTNDLGLDIFEGDGTLGQVDVHYSIDNVDFNEPDQTKSAFAQWCKDCHTNFHGDKGGAEVGGDPATNHDWKRHPVADVNIGNQSSHGHTSISRGWNKTGKANWVKVMDPDGLWDYSTATDAAPGEYTPSCFSCHKAHGNQNAFGLIYMSGTGTVSEEGDSDGTQAKNLCKQCHVQG